jgi:transcriptional regulator with XRE-family HTH domain
MATSAKLPKSSARAAVVPDAVAFLDAAFGGTPEWDAAVEQARLNGDVAHAIYDLRTKHRLTQRELAERVGTKQPVIARLEDADYEGHSLTMLNRIASALQQRVKIAFVPLRGAAVSTPDRSLYATRPDVAPSRAAASAGRPPEAAQSTKRSASDTRRSDSEPLPVSRRKSEGQRFAAAGGSSVGKAARKSVTAAKGKYGATSRKRARKSTAR